MTRDRKVSRGGRPSVTKGGDRPFSVKVSAEWLERAQRLAAKENMSVGDYVRALVLFADVMTSDRANVLAMLGDPRAERTIIEVIEEQPSLFTEADAGDS